MNRSVRLIALTLLAALSLAPAHAGAKATPASSLAMCHGDQLSLGTDAEGGSFDGMNQGGTLLVVRNISAADCRIQPIPQISFLGSDSKDIAIAVSQKNNPYAGPLVNGQRLPMGHGPVVPPIILPSGAEATLTLHWIAGNVFDHGVCVTPPTLRLTIDAATLQTPFQRQVCAQDAAHLRMTATRFALDPVYTP